MGSYLILIEFLLLTLVLKMFCTTSCILIAKMTALIRLYKVPKPTLRAYLVSSVLAVYKPQSQET